MAGIREFLGMGGYAFYVWGAYGVAAIIMIGLMVVSLKRLAHLKLSLAQIEGGDQGRFGRTARKAQLREARPGEDNP